MGSYLLYCYLERVCPTRAITHSLMHTILAEEGITVVLGLTDFTFLQKTAVKLGGGRHPTWASIINCFILLVKFGIPSPNVSSFPFLLGFLLSSISFFFMNWGCSKEEKPSVLCIFPSSCFHYSLEGFSR
jgi:hypothetical protein